MLRNHPLAGRRVAPAGLIGVSSPLSSLALRIPHVFWLDLESALQAVGFVSDAALHGPPRPPSAHVAAATSDVMSTSHVARVRLLNA